MYQLEVQKLTELKDNTMAEFNIDQLVKDATAGQDTSASSNVQVSSGTAATAKSKSGL